MLRRDLLQALLALPLRAGYTRLAAGTRPVGGTLQPRSAPLRAGVARIDITPGTPLSLEGYLEPAQRVSEGVHDRLFARAFAFRSGTSRLVIVSCDLGSLAFGPYLRRQVTDALGLRPEELLLCAIHTHSGPLLTLHPSYPANVAYTTQLARPLISVVTRALRSMSAARLAIARGRSAVGVSRRRLLADGRVQMASNPEGAADPEVLVLQVTRPDGTPIAALFDYACHSRSLRGTNRLLSGDVLGIAEQEVEGARHGLIAGAVAGASGDIDPVSIVDGFDTSGDAPPETVRLGRLLGQEVLRSMATPEDVAPATRIRSSAARIVLPPRHSGQHKWVEATVGAIGDVAFVGLDCEASVEIGLAIKSASPFGATFVITNCNGWSGYLPVARQYAEGGYEVERTGFGPGAAALLVEQIAGMLKRL